MPFHRNVAKLKFHLLGDLRVTHGEQDIPLGSGKQKLVLEALLSRYNRIVTVEQLIETAWHDTPPVTARKNLQVYISNLRSAFNRTGNLGRISHVSNGYRIIVRDEEVDIYDFDRAVQAGRTALLIGEYAEAAKAFQSALALWSAPPTPADVRGGEFLTEHLNWLYEQYVRALESWSNAEIEGGDCARVASVISLFLRNDPLREGLFVPYLKALSRCGRRTEAISVYSEMRKMLARELGISPSAALERLHQEILSGESEQQQDVRNETCVPPLLIPRDVQHFVGLGDLSCRVRQNLAEGNSVLLVGLAGVGKTSLAVRIAHQAGEDFPDGRIFVQVRGKDGVTRTTMSILREIAHGLGQPAAFSQSREAAVAAWQHWLSGRRILVIFDDVPPDHDIRDLLPRAGVSAAISTARRRIADLGTELRVPTPGPAEILRIMRSAMGDRGGVVPESSLAEVAEEIPPLRLAARIAGLQLGALPDAALSNLAEFLRFHPLQPDDLASGGLSLRDRMADQWQDLTEEERRSLLVLSCDLPDEFSDREAVAVLRRENRKANLTQLLETECLWDVSDDLSATAIRYTVPGALRQYARETGSRVGPGAMVMT